jgi:ubiquinone/menaquinone biosynthesis C-methylase UbiE
MGKPIDKIEFWDERIKDAKLRSQIHRSVYISTNSEWERIFNDHKKIINKLIKDDSKVLDAGCGYGRLAELFKKSNYIGVDFVPGFILEATKLYPGYVFFIQDLKNLSFKDKQFDWGICISMEKMVVANSGQAEWDKMLLELKRVCKKILILEYTDSNNYKVL